MLLGRLSSTTTGGGGTEGVGVCIRGSGGVEVLFLLTPSVRAARAGSFLFLSMVNLGMLAGLGVMGSTRLWSDAAELLLFRICSLRYRRTRSDTEQPTESGL